MQVVFLSIKVGGFDTVLHVLVVARVSAIEGAMLLDEKLFLVKSEIIVTRKISIQRNSGILHQPAKIVGKCTCVHITYEHIMHQML